MTTASIPLRAPTAPVLDPRTLKAIVAINGIVPLAILLWDYNHNQLGADPAHYALLTTGLLSVIFLLLTLLITPLRALTHWNTLAAARRALGLYAFFYACIHVSIYFLHDASASLPFFFHEIYTRFYLLIGITALTLMAPLALTSTNGMIQLLGAPRWKLLHKAIYFVAILAIIHYCLHSKLVSTQQYLFVLALVLLLGYRFVAQFLQLAPQKKSFESRLAAAAPGKKKFWKGELRIEKITVETPHVRTFRLVPLTGNQLPFDYLPGQYLNITLNVHGKKISRSFTIASTPSRPGSCEISVKHEPAGTATPHLHNAAQVGDVVTISAPAGHFTFTGSEATSIVLIAGGVGITPLMSVIRYLTDKSWTGQIHLAFTAKAEQDIIFKNELEILEHRFPNLHLHYTLTQSNPATWKGHTGRITTDFLQKNIPILKTSRIHLCGPDQMVQQLCPALLALGIPESHIHFESFTRAAAPMPTESELAPAVTSSAAPVENPTITFALSQKSASPLPEESLLETAERYGIPIQSDCRSGICGTCKTQLLTGSVTMETQDALTPKEKSQRIILACQAHPITDVTLQA